MNPPFNRSPAEVGRMTDAQVFGWFTGFERGEGGVPKFSPARRDEPPLTTEQVYRAFLFLNGITGGRQDRLWAEEKARRDRADGETVGGGPGDAEAATPGDGRPHPRD